MWLQTDGDWRIYQPDPEIFWGFNYELVRMDRAFRIHWIVTSRVAVTQTSGLEPVFDSRLNGGTTDPLSVDEFVRTWQQLHDDPAPFMMLRTLSN